MSFVRQPPPLTENADKPVFPSSYWSGISKRELFALIALHAILSRGEAEDVTHNAIVAYRNADAMLAERSK